MHYLVRFIDDNILYICQENQIKNKKDSSKIKQVRYKHHGIFEAEIIYFSEDINIINKTYQELINDKNPNTEDCSVSSIQNNDCNHVEQSTDELINNLEEPICFTENEPEDEIYNDPLISSDSIADPSFVPDYIDSTDNEETNHESEQCAEKELFTTDQRTSIDITNREITNEDLNAVRCALFSNCSATDKDESNSEDHLRSTSFENCDRVLSNIRKNNETVALINGTISACSDVGMEVAPSNKAVIKKAFCCFCKKLQTKLVRHLETVHKNEPEVLKFCNLPKCSKERRDIIDTLRRHGNFIFNRDSSLNKGQLIVCRRPQQEKNRPANHYIPCPKCKGFFSVISYRKHFHLCSPSSKKGERNLLIKGRKVLGRIHERANNVLRNDVFPVLREDDIITLIRYDELIIIYGNKLCDKYTDHHHYDMIRQRLRLAGRFLKEIKIINKDIKDFSNILQPKYYDNSIEAVKKVASFNEVTKTFAAPSVASNLGTLLKKMGNLYISECIKQQNESKQKLTQDFLKLLEEDYETSINKTATENQLQTKRQKKVLLPTKEDIQLLTTYLRDNRRKFATQLESKFSYIVWKKFSEITLTSIQLFNRRRSGEIERIYISDFNSYQQINEETHGDVFNSLSTDGQDAVKKYARFVIRGKLARGVPVLLPVELLEAVKLILLYRHEAGVTDKNPYVFGIPGNNSNNHLRACNLMRQFSKACGAKMQHTLRGTQLRKQIATYSVLLNLTESDVSDLANFMGHADKIHKDHYRIPIETREITKISKLLEMAQGESDSEDDTNEPELNANVLPQNSNTKSRCVSPIGSVQKNKWTLQEIQKAREEFSWNITNKVLPSLDDCNKVKQSVHVLKNRSPVQMKSWVSNQIKKTRRIKRPTEKQVVKKTTWSIKEKKALQEAFKKNYQIKKLPSLLQCEEARNKYSALKLRSPTVIKAAVNNYIKRINK